MKHHSHTRYPTVLALCAMVGVSMCLAGCATDDGGGGGGNIQPAAGGLDKVGAVKSSGSRTLVRIAGIDTAAAASEGRVAYTVDNAAGSEILVTYSVSFVFPGRTQGSMVLPETTETSSEKTTRIPQGGTGVRLSVDSATARGLIAAGQQLVGTRLNITETPIVLVREGALVYQNSLRCTKLDFPFEGGSNMVVTVTNEGRYVVKDVIARAAFVDGDSAAQRIIGETPEVAVRPLKPGETQQIVFDISSVRGSISLADPQFFIKMLSVGD